VLALFPNGRHHYSDAEATLLREETYVLSGKGDALVQRRFLKVEDNLRFAWNMYFRGLPIEPELDFGNSGWTAFKNCLGIRHRVTHPKSPEDMEISDTEFKELQEAYMWVHATTWRNVARALLAFRQQDYARLNKVLPSPVLQWLDGRGVIDKRSRTLSPLDLSELSADEGTRKVPLELLESHELICSSDDGIAFTQSCADYVTWRARAGQNSSSDIPRTG
jgi:hypothetical protein